MNTRMMHGMISQSSQSSRSHWSICRELIPAS